MDSRRIVADACSTGSLISADGCVLSACPAMRQTSIPLNKYGEMSKDRNWQTSVLTPLVRYRTPPKTAWTASAATPHSALPSSVTPVYDYDPPQPAVARSSLSAQLTSEVLHEVRGLASADELRIGQG